MGLIVLFFAVIGFICFPLVRCAVFNPHLVSFYSVKDIFDYFRYRKWEEFNEFGISMFVGMFGHGKTLTMTHKARMLYNKYGDSLRFISNYKLIGIPYTPLVNFNQLIDLQADSDENIKGYVVLIDEISSVLSHRNFSSFPLDLLPILLQQRKRKIVIYCSSQRFFMVDKIFRSVTNYVYDCNKYWRFQTWKRYDAWDYENAMNVRLISSIGRGCWFVRNKDFDSYDTSQIITKEDCSNFISNEEAIVRKGFDSQVNEIAIQKPSRVLKKKLKK